MFRILNMIRDYMIDELKKDGSISFAFMGAPTVEEMDEEQNAENINPDDTIGNSKRWRVYVNYLARYLSIEDYDHYKLQSVSCYMFNLKKNHNVGISEAKTFFERYLREEV